MHDILNGSFSDLGIVKVFGFISDDRSELIHNVLFSSGKIATLFYSLATKEWRIEI